MIYLLSFLAIVIAICFLWVGLTIYVFYKFVKEAEQWDWK